MTAPSLFLPTDEYVASALLSDLLAVPAATSLPKLDQWPVFSGTIRAFVTVDIVGGGANANRLQDPVVSVHTWAAVPGSDNPQWGAAAQLGHRVWDASQERDFEPRTYRQSAKYVPALVLGLSPVARPRRIPDPDASMAHFATEVRVHYVPEGV
jgi:hypothetical protein